MLPGLKFLVKTYRDIFLFCLKNYLVMTSEYGSRRCFVVHSKVVQGCLFDFALASSQSPNWNISFFLVSNSWVLSKSHINFCLIYMCRPLCIACWTPYYVMCTYLVSSHVQKVFNLSNYVDEKQIHTILQLVSY